MQYITVKPLHLGHRIAIFGYVICSAHKNVGEKQILAEQVRLLRCITDLFDL